MKKKTLGKYWYKSKISLRVCHLYVLADQICIIFESQSEAALNQSRDRPPFHDSDITGLKNKNDVKSLFFF